MSAARLIETRLPEVLETLSNPRTPAYYDDILGQVARTRQRPGWTFIERWLPMAAISERLATAPRIPMRVAIALLLLLLAFATTVLIAGALRPTVPAPFGVAGNGSIVFTDSSGAINVGSLTDGKSRVIVPGSGHSKPVFSPDGRWLAYLQVGDAATSDIVVSGPNGDAPQVLSTAQAGSIGHFTWTPDSRAVIAVVGAEIQAFDLAGGAPRVIFKDPGGFKLDYLDNQNGSLADIFRPPNGDEILFIGTAGSQFGLYRQALAGGDPIPVVTDKTVPSVWFENPSGAQWSPDGRRIVLTIHPPETPAFGRAYVVNADGSGLQRVSKLELPGIVIDEEHTAWSPDGTRIAFGRWNNDADGNVDPRPVVIVDLATGEEREASNREVNGYSGWTWSPDGSSILQVPGDGSEDAGTVIVVDAATGQSHKIGWMSGSAPTWQRTLPGT
jgi:dipeptidyl aminopeptidase/acylaminoacyl peptidase